ncbi:DUF2141 domain-containing protein [Sphingobium sufflavum]|jgi:uncharacterized protein (DUF2141 family)|uniref:DUF2141 domain-containing protein n=1 Tax=Sphingobium sufflavum TaxID=1129547 RepID=UPI001F3AD5CD|nr:DUF2141 domain-containing protein [Sphingobium sufflavum]MCE7796771.1 DUF2141 domain-containing protein [Sphingobium sufflavum]
MMSLLMLAATIASSPDLGKAEGQCRANEAGPAFLVDVTGLKDRKGNLKLELYPANDQDFLADDNILLMAGKAFRRVEMEVPKSGAVQMCIRAPAAGTYALSLLHDRDSNRKMGLSIDGIGFPSNPKLCWGQPKSGDAKAVVGNGPTRVAVTMQYRRNLVCFGPVKN